jgi:hypothetical protein
MRDLEFVICSWQFAVFQTFGIADCQLQIMMNKVPNPDPDSYRECDATDDDSGTNAGYIMFATPDYRLKTPD